MNGDVQPKPFGATVTVARWTVRRVLAVPIWQLCSLIDRVPWWFQDVGWQRHGCLGCYPLRLSRLAIKVEGLLLRVAINNDGTRLDV